MKLFGKILLYTFAGILVLIVVAFSYLMIAFPKVGPATDIKIEVTPDRIARGKYLFHNVSICVDCHSPRNWNQFSAPPDESRTGSGNVDDFAQKAGFPGDFYAPNITLFNLKNWTDGELIRAITCGVNKDGNPLFPVMPYLNFGKMSREDIYSIVSYLRTLSPIDNAIPPSKPKFPMSLIMKMMPKEAEFSEIPSKSDAIKYGKYIITAASCGDCHTPMEKGQPISGMEFAGGREFPIPTGGKVRSANLTPDENTGIGGLSKDVFIMLFKAYDDSTFVFPEVQKNQFNTVMPWKKYAGMNKEDLGAIYDYLRSLKPINNNIEKFTPDK